MRRLVLVVLTCVLPVQTADRFQLTIDSIMRGPELVGYEPRALRWAGNSERVYFDWKRATDSLLADFDTYVVEKDGSGLRKLSRDEAKLTPPWTGGSTSLDHRWTVYAKEGDLYLYDGTSDKARRLTDTSDAESDPQMLRDNKRVAFTRAGNLYVMTLDGGSVVQMTDIRPPGAVVPPSEKKGTASQEYVRAEERSLIDVVKQRAARREEDEKRNPRKPLRLTGKQSVMALQLTPDEATVMAMIGDAPEGPKQTIVPAFVTESAYTEPLTVRTKVGDVSPASLGKLALIDVKTGAVQYVTHGLKTKDEKDRELRLGMPRWSDDGRHAMVQAFSADNKDRWIMALEGAMTRVIFTEHDDAWVNRGMADVAAWLNDSDLYFISERDGRAHLYAVPFSGGEPRQLTSGKWEVSGIRLSRDKKKFYIESNEQHFGESHIYSMDVTGGPRQKLTGPAGQHTGVVSPDGKQLAAVYSYVTKPPELYVGDKKVTDSPLPEFWSFNWKDAPIVQVPARDGANIPGRLFKARQRGGPAVIFVHGAGYLQNVHKGWSNYYREYMFHHILAERGYTVLDIDYRGSQGYGRDWRTAIYRHMGGKDLDDHVDAARWLVKEHGVDAKRIGIYGGSYGGFITLMAMFKHSDVFAAGAALRPVTDWAHYNHGYTSAILNRPQADAEAFKRSSPIYFAEGLTGALLICHGMVDVNVHVQDTVRLAQKLIELRKENWEMALYPVEDHAFVQPTSWADEYKRILKLFETNLQRHVSGP